ncbi:MAG: energy-coupling factor transporter ATP-binding protein EcfA2 [Planctomycetota bacterium]|jgi:energy-coupling factor transporter ATP-binding protein EcfA2
MSLSIQEELSIRLGALCAELDADIERVEMLSAFGRHRERIERLRADLNRQLDRVHKAPVITLVGATGAGKSTLLNALVGRQVAIEGTERPTTRRPVIYAPRDANLSELTGGLPGEEPDVVRYDAVDGEIWSEQVLIDAPDVNSVAAEHRDVVRALADKSDILLVVMHRQSVVEDASVSFVDHFVGRRAMVFVLGRADELTEESRELLLTSLRELASDRFQSPDAPIFALSAHAAQTNRETPGWQELTNSLADFVKEGVLGGVRRHNAMGTAAALQDVFREFAADQQKALTELPGAIEAGLSDLANKTAEEVALRLSLRRADLASTLWNETAKRWDGPGGWTLRAGGLSGLGVGAGLLVARRNPLLAAGTAAGSYAVSKLRQSAERRRVTEVSEIFPAQSEFETWYLDAMGPARRQAALLTGSTSAFGLPDSSTAVELLAPRVADEWNNLIQRDLPAAAESSAVNKLRLPFDFPVYALGVYVVYLAVQGYLSNEFLGMDFLVNTTLLLLAYLFAVRTLCRRVLGARAKRLLADVITRSRVSMQAATAKAQNELCERTAEVSDSLERLSALEERWREEFQLGR